METTVEEYLDAIKAGETSGTKDAVFMRRGYGGLKSVLDALREGVRVRSRLEDVRSRLFRGPQRIEVLASKQFDILKDEVSQMTSVLYDRDRKEVADIIMRAQMIQNNLIRNQNRMMAIEKEFAIAYEKPEGQKITIKSAENAIGDVMTLLLHIEQLQKKKEQTKRRFPRMFM